MRVVGSRRFLSIGEFDAIDLPDFAIIIGLNGAGKSHFLKAIEAGAVHSDVLDPISDPHAGPVPGIRLLRGDDPAPEGLTVGLRTEPNAIFGAAGPSEDVQRQHAALVVNIRQQLLTPARPQLEEALGGSLDELASPATSALRLSLNRLLCAARDKGFNVDEARVLEIFASADERAEAAASSYGGGPAMVAVSEARQRAKTIGRPLISLDDDELTRLGSWGTYGLFDTHFVRVFLQYRNRKLVNAFRRITGGDQAADALTDLDFVAHWGAPPWDRVSAALEAFDLPYRVEEPSMDPYAPVHFKLQRADGVPVDFGNLSSGEKVLIRFALSAFQVGESRLNVQIPRLLLLDEVDAALHPQNVHRLLGAIQEGFVGRLGVPVIMTTHSPTTVALGPDGAIFEMTEDARLPRPVTKQGALNRLTVGLPTLSIDYSGRRQVFVESSIDAAQYDRLANIIKGILDLPRTLHFIAAGGTEGGDSRGGCTIVRRIVEGLAKNGANSVFGLVDWDGKNDPTGPVKVLAHGTHYAKENVLLDPLLVAILLLLDKPKGVSFPISLPGIRAARQSDLQALADVVIQKMGFDDDMTQNFYLSGPALTVPQQYQQMNGHQLEARLREKFPSLNRYSGSGKSLVDQVVDRVLHDFPELCPKPIADLFCEIATQVPA